LTQPTATAQAAEKHEKARLSQRQEAVERETTMSDQSADFQMVVVEV
jgi:hypothetical protein